MLQISPDTVLINSNERFVYANPAALRMFAAHLWRRSCAAVDSRWSIRIFVTRLLRCRAAVENMGFSGVLAKPVRPQLLLRQLAACRG